MSILKFGVQFFTMRIYGTKTFRVIIQIFGYQFIPTGNFRGVKPNVHVPEEFILKGRKILNFSALVVVPRDQTFRVLILKLRVPIFSNRY